MSEPTAAAATAAATAVAAVAVPLPDYHEHAKCLGCGYALRGLAEARCPECGREFDPNDPMTMNVPGISRRKPPKPIPFSVGIILWAIVLTPFTAMGMVAGNSPSCVIAAIGWIGICVAWRNRNVKERAAAARGEPLGGTRLWRYAVLVMLTLSLLSGIGWHGCPHGRYYRFGPLAVFHDHVGGGPCRNYVRGTRFELPQNWYLIVS